MPAARGDLPPLSARQLNRATLGRQLLLGREPLSAVEGIARITAVQAQEAASPYVALWNRLRAFDPHELDEAFRDGSVVKATLMRITLHAVSATDYPVFHEAMQPTLRAARLSDRRYTAAGVSVAEAERLLDDIRGFAAQARTNAEVEAWLRERFGDRAHPGIWWALRQVGPFVHAPTGGPWSFGPRPSYRSAPGPVVDRSPGITNPLGHLVRRYLEAFGPATAQDIRAFGLLYAPHVRAAIDALGDELVRLEGPGGMDLLDVPNGPLPSEDSPAPPLLLGMWDSVLLAYKDRARIIPPDYRRRVIQGNGDVLPSILVDGQVAGVWRATEDGIEATAFHRLPARTWQALEAEAVALVAFLRGREPAVYRRYARWWQGMTGADVRILAR